MIRQIIEFLYQFHFLIATLARCVFLDIGSISPKTFQLILDMKKSNSLYQQIEVLASRLAITYHFRMPYVWVTKSPVYSLSKLTEVSIHSIGH
jgi:hypothetical protein